MNQEEIKKNLDVLADYQSQRDLIMLEKQKLIDSILTPEIKQQIADIELEFSGKAGTVTEKAAALEMEIKEAVKETGATVKSAYLQAVYMKGRISWDTKAMDGYAVDHPEILFMRKEGDPSVSMRKV